MKKLFNGLTSEKVSFVINGFAPTYAYSIFFLNNAVHTVRLNALFWSRNASDVPMQRRTQDFSMGGGFKSDIKNLFAIYTLANEWLSAVSKNEIKVCGA